MTAQLLLALPLRGLRLGPMRLTPYGASAAIGVVLAMSLSGRAAKRVDIEPEAAWDAGLFAIVSCFAASRLLLVLADPRAFVRYPVLVLSLPSLTLAGMVLAAVVVWMYLRRKGLLLLSVLDLFAPCGAVLAAFLELGHWLDGSEPGMPVFRGAKDQVVRLVPVSLYGVFLACALAGVLWVVLDRARGRALPAGRVAALGLLLGGLTAFGLDMLSLPVEIASGLPLEPGQFVALGAMLGGALLWQFGARA